ncbi:uncharacterized protein CHSO_1259 [Chryseobacterium sp. StRB126]|uniref:hypothetical protein n=1 Tax=Chryseobacterium sp. StRB126 TaxID=878220 RepID=UPI0004E98765|nr:hypothetical protein [Chryseobacterium sp. StRB126]BAP30296.1 uncharacterized protein CHSO_1259 [Chryseobacterium sp. StRB126]
MSRTRIVKGTYTKISQEGHSMYSRENIITSAGESVTETGVEQGIKYGDPEDPPKRKGRIIDILMFVAGTTDPGNTEGTKHKANTSYWKYIDEKTKEETKESLNNLWNRIKELRPQFNDLHIEGDFFSWSGDNDTKERTKASERLFDLLLRMYPGWKNQEVHLHLIGHSHGGNVINQFTELISSKDMIAKSSILKPRKITEFPKEWKVKSITYLSTPFFQKKHQLNHGKLHKECKIINVHNEYDLTQQLIADFSLTNLEGLLKSFQVEKFKTGIETLKSVNNDTILTYLKGIGLPNSHKKRAVPAWKEMAKAFLGINMMTKEFINYIDSLKIENSNLQKEKDSFISLLNNLLRWTYDVYNNYNAGIAKGYDKATWAQNLNLTQGLRVLNILFDIKSSPKDSYLLSLLAGVFGENKGITDSIDETSWTPKKQTKGLSIIDVPIFESDPYNSRNKRKEFDAFLKGAQGAVHARELEDLLMRLFSQFIKPLELKKIIGYIDDAEYIVTGNLDAQLKILRGNLRRYDTFVTRYYAGLVTEQDEKTFKDDMKKRPGSLAYLAMASHSLSHTQLWGKVEEGLQSSFSSEKKAKYNKK